MPDDVVHHFPPELLSLLVDAIPRLFKSKRAVIDFFRGAGVPESLCADLAEQLARNRDSINGFHIARTVLIRLNEKGEAPWALRARREVVKRVVEFEDFSTCWPDRRLEAEGLVAKIRTVVDVKDSFTKMRQEREREVHERVEIKQREADSAAARLSALDAISRDLGSLFAETDPRRRGTQLEGVLNRLFSLDGVLVRESFTRRGEPREGVVEQIDGVIALDGKLYLVEVKWHSDSLGRDQVSSHLVRVFNRGDVGGVLISASSYSPAALKDCTEALTQKTIVLTDLEQYVKLLEARRSVAVFLRERIRAAVVDKNPYVR